ncbi:MAG: serine hydrolase domain-containing protein [Granulosicoccus sp.]
MSDLVLRADYAFRPAALAVEQRRIPGVVLGVIAADGQREVRLAGAAQYIPAYRDMTRDTWFDLASLTKVIFTSPAIIALHEQGMLDLSQPLTTVLPDLQQYKSDSWIRKVTFEQCLSHQSGFPAVEPVYTYGRDPALLRAFVLQRDWAQCEHVYSDINFILLGIALERIRKKRITDMYPGRGFAFEADASKAAATELCTWREKVLCGEVHDDNCFALQGAGHAGLFGTVDAVLDHAQDLLNATPETKPIVDMMRKPVSETRTLGWEKFHVNWSGGQGCSHLSIGHTGFTGTGLWVDFENRLAWTLLTNRIHPTRHSASGIVSLRHDVGSRIFSRY